MAILHLDGDENEWWFHGLKTLGHDNIKTYKEFVDRVLERFEQKYPEFSFKELAQLKQVGTTIEYMLEFQRLSVKVYNVSMGRLVFPFTEFFADPLKGLVKFHKPTNLNDAMSLTRDLQNVLPGTRFPPKPIQIWKKALEKGCTWEEFLAKRYI